MKADLLPKRITIRGYRWVMHVNLEVLISQRPLKDIVKIFKWMTEDTFQNREAFSQFDDWLTESTVRAKRAWEAASQAYVNGWKGITRHYVSRDAKAKIRQENARLTDELKFAKHIYERVCQVHQMLKEHVTKYRIIFY